MASVKQDERAGPRASAREQLLTAASGLMKERDSLDVSLNEIAGRAQVNSALVKYYFGNKHGLLLALLERDLLTAITQLNGLVEMDISPMKKMRIHLAGVVKLYFELPYLQRLTIALMQNVAEDVASGIADKFLKPIHEAYNRIIADGVTTGEFRYVDPKLFYFTVIGACDQIFSARAVLKYVYGREEIGDDLRRAYADHIAALITDGLRV